MGESMFAPKASKEPAMPVKKPKKQITLSLPTPAEKARARQIEENRKSLKDAPIMTMEDLARQKAQEKGISVPFLEKPEAANPAASESDAEAPTVRGGLLAKMDELRKMEVAGESEPPTERSPVTTSDVEGPQQPEPPIPGAPVGSVRGTGIEIASERGPIRIEPSIIRSIDEPPASSGEEEESPPTRRSA